MNKYKIDTHVHTSETSRCGKISASRLVRLYKEINYSGLVITDHYYKNFFDSIESKSWTEKIDRFLMGFFNAQKEGKKLGMGVILGMEIKFESDDNDYLVYGINEDFLYNNKELYNLGIENFRKLINDKNVLIYQAHPFRSKCSPANPDFIHGIEVYNGNRRHDSNNDWALDYAKKHNLKMISGSDFHRKEDLGRGGIILADIPKKPTTFVKMLNNNSIIGIIEDF